MSFHIGNLINEQRKKAGMTKSEFARRIASSPQSIHYALKRKSIDTDLLQKISKTLDYDFFQHYIGGKRSNHLINFSANEMKDELNRVKNELEIITRQNEYLKEIIALIKPASGVEQKENTIRSKKIGVIKKAAKTKTINKPNPKNSMKNSAKKKR
jgi:transcriptional regulator with XRE-family HTH domain